MGGDMYPGGMPLPGLNPRATFVSLACDNKLNL